MPVRRGAGHVEAVVLAGGLGSRLRPAVSDRPKPMAEVARRPFLDRKSTRLNSSHVRISYAVFCLKKKTTHQSYVRPSAAIVRYCTQREADQRSESHDSGSRA